MLALLLAEDRVIESAFLHSLYVDLISGLRRHRAAAAAPATRGADAGDGDGGDADDGGDAPRQRRAEAAALTNASLTTLGEKIERCVERTTLLATPRARRVLLPASSRSRQHRRATRHVAPRWVVRMPSLTVALVG